MREVENARAGRGEGDFGRLMSGFVVAVLAVFFGLVGSGIVPWAMLFSFYMGD